MIEHAAADSVRRRAAELEQAAESQEPIESLLRWLQEYADFVSAGMVQPASLKLRVIAHRLRARVR